MVYVVVLNWNARDETLRCLESLTWVRYPRLKVIVVDNGSNDHSVAAVRSRFPNLEVIANPDNLGYAGGNNIGISRALRQGAEYVLVLNNDAKLAVDAVDEAVATAKSLGPRVGVVGMAIYEANNPEQVYCYGSDDDQILLTRPPDVHTGA